MKSIPAVMNRMLGLGPWIRMVAIVATVAATGMGGSTVTHAQSQGAGGDDIELLDLGTARPGPQAAPGTISFQVSLRYRLQSASAGYLKLLLAEDDGRNTIDATRDPIRVEKGEARMGLELNYPARDEVTTVRLVGQLFNSDSVLLDSFSTVPLVLPHGGGRRQFDAAMSARAASNYLRAAELLTAALIISPTTGQYYYWRADTAVHLGWYAESVGDYSRALELMPGDRASRVGRGIALLWLEQWEAAVGDLTIAIDSSPGPDQWTAAAYRARGLALAGLGQAAAARVDYEAYLGIRPDAPDRSTVEGWIAGAE